MEGDFRHFVEECDLLQVQHHRMSTDKWTVLTRYYRGSKFHLIVTPLALSQ